LIDIEFSLSKRWALKDNQKNRRSQDKINTQDICNELLKYVESRDIEEEDILKISTIQNWLSSYAYAFKQKATDNELELGNLEIFSCNILQI
ncbi:27075_t:CDS:2, partial [Racocetra persica]